MKKADLFGLVVTLALILTIGLAMTAAADPQPPAFTWVAVRSNATTNGTQLCFGAKLSGFGPISSGSLNVTWPDGATVTTFATTDLYYDTDGSYYWKYIDMPVAAPAGEFVFSVNNSLGEDQASSNFNYNPVPVVSSASMTPADSTFTETTTPTFTWAPVTIPGTTTCYRVEIFDWQKNLPVYRSARFSSTDAAVTFTVPAGILQASLHYQWRVQAGDSLDWEEEQNRSRSDFHGFYTGAASAPEFVWTLFRSNNRSAGLFVQAGAQVKGIFPSQMTGLNVSSPANGIDYDFQDGDLLSDAGGAYYWVTVPVAAPQDETVTWQLESPTGSDAPTYLFNFSLVPIVDVNSIQVGGETLGNNAYIDSLNPTFSWPPVSIPGKTTYYRAQIYDWNNTVMIYSTPRQTDTFCTVPAGVLQPESAYRLVVRPTDGGGGNPEYNQSISDAYYFQTVNGEVAGTIAGVVRQLDGVTPIGGATVEALGATNQQVNTASDGSYTLNLPPGSYRLRVSAPGYAREHFDNVTPSSEATLVAVSSGSAQIIDFDLNQGGSISGRIYQDDGMTSVADAQICVRPSLYFFDDGFYATTAADGSYAVTGLALGQYKVRVEADGYARLRYYNNVYGWSNAAPVSVTPPQDTSGIDIRLDPAGVIAGFVRAADGTTPIQVGIIVDPSTGGFEGIGTQSSAVDGSYRIEGLPPNTYSVRIGDNYIPGWYAGEFYNGRQTWQTADGVPVTVGATASGINFTLDEGGAVTGTVYNAATLQPISGIQLRAFLSASGQGVTPLPVTGPGGTFRINLLPGTYKIQAHSGGAFINEWYGGVQNMEAATAVTVNFQQITSGIDIYLDRPGSISGTVYESDGISPLPGASLYAFPVDPGLQGNGINAQPNGTYTINGLAPGTYAVFVTATGHVSDSRQVTVVGNANTPHIDFNLGLYPYTVNIVGQAVVGTSGGSVGVTDPSSPIAMAGVDIPGDALGESTVITVGQVDDAPPLPPGVGSIGSVIHYGPEGLTFNAAVTLKIPYTEEDLAAAGVADPADLDVYTFNSATELWELVTGAKAVDETNNLILIDVFHFSIYSLGHEIQACLGDSEPDGDVDGLNLWHYAAGGLFDDIAEFGLNFGRTNCQ